MSAINCESCANLREFAPDFVQNGVTDTVSTSLKNNTGFNPALTVLRDNCTDLNDANDCLIGRMTDELKAYDVCDWKEFMGRLLPNQYEVLKAIIANDCGQWLRMSDLCNRIMAMVQPSLDRFGIAPYRDVPTNYGTIATKDGAPLITTIVAPSSTADPYAKYAIGLGVKYAKMELAACEGSGRETYEWLGPWLTNCMVSQSAVAGDILWYIDRTTLQNITGMSDELWGLYSETVGLWTSAPLDDHRYGWFQMTAKPEYRPGYLCLIYAGTSYPDTGLTRDTMVIGAEGETRYRTR